MVTNELYRFGVTTFGERGLTAHGELETPKESLQHCLAEAILSEKLGADFFYVGEHHQSEYSIAAPEIILTHIAAHTARITFGTAVTVISLDDPVRVFERYLALQRLSDNRAELILGKGAFPADFTLFGKPPTMDSTLFSIKVDQLCRIIDDHPTDVPLHIKIGTGGTPETIALATHKNMPLVITLIDAEFSQYRSLYRLYSNLCTSTHQQQFPLGVYAVGHIADTDQAANSEFYPGYTTMYNALARTKGGSPMSEEEYHRRIGPRGSLLVGSPDTVAIKIAQMLQTVHAVDFQFKYSCASLSTIQRLHSLELYFTEVVPRVKKLLTQ